MCKINPSFPDLMHSRVFTVMPLFFFPGYWESKGYAMCEKRPPHSHLPWRK